MTEADDPFAHLHDEAYAGAFVTPRATHADMIAMSGRPRVSLNGAWRFPPDLFDEGLRQRWFEDTLEPPEAWTKPRDYDEAAAEQMEVPSCWTMARPEWRFFEGGAWYTRHFTWPKAVDGERLFLRVGAAQYEARVFLNGRFLASHRGGSTPFFVELTAHLLDRENHLQINVDNRRHPDRVPMNHFDWFNHGGLFREVELVPVPPVFIRDFDVHLVPDGRFQDIAIRVSLSDPVSGEALVEIPELGLRAPIAVRDGKGEVVIIAAPELWSPESPRTEGEQILLNGHPIWLRGVCVHEDDELLGRVTNEHDIRRRFADARSLGANFLRLAHYPHHERVAEIADEMGFLLWSEIPVYWAIAFDNPDTFDDARGQLLELIARDRQRASVIIWGVGNENADTEARYHFMSRLAETARAADPTRLVSAACLINRERFEIADRLAAHLDVVGINEYFGWYEPDFSGLDRLLTNSRPGKPVVISETGADAQAGYQGAVGQLFSEAHQAELYRRQLDIIDRYDYVRGFCAWILYDYRTERRQTRFQRGWNRKGLIAEDKITRKLAFTVLGDAFRRRLSRNQ